MTEPPDTYLWDPTATPDPEIAALEAALRPVRYDPHLRPFRPRRRRPWVAYAFAAAASIAVIGLWQAYAMPQAYWHVRSEAGTPFVDAQPISTRGVIRPGESLETDGRSEATLHVGHLGRAEVGPNTRLTLLRSGGAEYRVALARGKMHARIWAPPRFFIVDVPGAVAIDMGCVYTLEVDTTGHGLLSVSSGLVELAGGGRRSFVFAGSSARLFDRGTPGVVVSSRAPASFRHAVEQWEEAAQVTARAHVFDALLIQADSFSTITLWHMLDRASVEERRRLYHRLASLAPPPPDVSERSVLQLDARSLASWRNALEPAWSGKPTPIWKRAWRTGWTWIMGRE